MTQVSDITTTLTSGLTHIDALLNSGPDWNYLTPATNTLSYTFSIASGNEANVFGQQAFSEAQKNATQTALSYLGNLTGITFTETTDGSAANIHFCLIDIAGASTAGLCSTSSNYSYSGSTITRYNANAYVYLDNAEWLAANSNLTPGGQGYETLLHELGHALGLKHPFDGSPTLSSSQDNTANTLMSYTSKGGPYSSYSPYDIAALNWLYGGDGLGGALGVGSNVGGRYWTGTQGADILTGGNANDKFLGWTGNDTINGGLGIDTAVYSYTRSHYQISRNATGFSVNDNSSDGLDTLSNIERLQFSDMSVALDIEGNAGLTARIIGAVFGAASVANKSYVGIGLNVLDAGTSYQELLKLALDARLGVGYSNADEVNLLYLNLGGNLPSTADLNYWTNAISSGQYTQSSLAVLAANLDLNATNINLIGLASTGLEFV